MVVPDPAAELVELVRAMGDPAPCESSMSARRRALLIRRRFGLALPPPLVTVDPSAPIRPARPEDAAAIAAVKWRVFGTDYRGLLPDRFLDERGIVPAVSYWRDRAAGARAGGTAGSVADGWGLLVWGGPGVVQGYLEWGPVDDAHRRSEARSGPAPRVRESEGAAGRVGAVGEVFEIYVDPCARGAGGGGRLLDEAVGEMRASGLVGAELSVLEANTAAQDFYRGRDWVMGPDSVLVDLGVVRFRERRFARSL